ncbi:hypothetical protein MHYP_G00301850 [Metynnis hypsauchen]
MAENERSERTMGRVDDGTSGQGDWWTIDPVDNGTRDCKTNNSLDLRQTSSATIILSHFLFPRSSPSKQAESGPSPGVTLMKADVRMRRGSKYLSVIHSIFVLTFS